MFKLLKKDIDKSLTGFLKEIKSDKVFRPLPDFLHSGIENFIKRDGKRIRPILSLLGYMGYSNKKFSYKKLVRSSISLELLHDFLLIHDDVIDNSDLRRGEPTLHKIFNKNFKRPPKDNLGPNLSIVAGDTIFALSLETLLSFNATFPRKQKALKIFTKTAASTGIGEYLDVVNNFKKLNSLTEKDIFRVYTMKTARYTFEGPLLMGATLAGAPMNELKKLSTLATALGEAFQIQADLLDISSSSKKTGKPVLSDIAEGKKTLLLWYTYKKANAKDKKNLIKTLEKKQKTHKDLISIKLLMRKYKADEYCAKSASHLVKKALKITSNLKIKKNYKEVLENFIHKSFNII